MGSSPHDLAAARGARPDHPGFGRRLPGRALAREIGVSLPTVQRWLDRYDEGGAGGT